MTATPDVRPVGDLADADRQDRCPHSGGPGPIAQGGILP